MPLALIPQPKKMVPQDGVCRIPRRGRIAITDGALFDLARQAQRILPGHKVDIDTDAAPATLRLVFARAGFDMAAPDGYRLRIASEGMRIEAGTIAGVRHGLMTLRQALRQGPGTAVPCLLIEDWPDFPVRGVYYDVCRGRVPKLERLFDLADELAAIKINQLQLYVEHTFRFRAHPRIGRGASPLTPEDVMRLDAHCRGLGIELVPSLAAFGHLDKILTLPEYRHLAEDRGVGDFAESTPHAHLRGWSLAPAVPEVYDFLDSLFREYLPCFSSDQFNVCCDEVWDLGMGQSHALARRIGKDRLYLLHLKRLAALCRKYGKRMMFWGSLVRDYPELAAELPRNCIPLEWEYESRLDYDEKLAHFQRSGLEYYVCPTVSSYCSLFPRLHEAAENIAKYARQGLERGAAGLLNTDWGDGGHFNFQEYSWHGYLFGAEQGWNPKADRASFHERCLRTLFGRSSEAWVRALIELGDIAQTRVEKPTYFYQSIWWTIFFALPGDPVFEQGAVSASVSHEGRLAYDAPLHLDAKFGADAARQLTCIRRVFRAESRRAQDRLGLLPYWMFGIDTLFHAAGKLAVLGPGGTDTSAARRRLASDMARLKHRFTDLWLARSRRSEITVTLACYERAIHTLNAGQAQ